MPYAANGRARLHWEERGSGTPLLLVMGHTHNSSMWYAARDALAERHRVITFDNRGTGKSSAVRKISVPDMAADAFAVLDAAGVSTAHLYGVSMGGGIVLEMARQRPDRVSSLVLGCTMAKTPDVAGMPTLLRPLLHLPAPVLFQLLKRMKREDNPHPYGTRAPADRIEKDQAILAAMGTPVRTSVAQSRGINAYSIGVDEVRALSMPDLVVHGDEDAAVPYSAGRRLHELIAHSEMLTLPGAGHNYFVAAADEANARVLDFLRRVDACEPGETTRTPELSA
jgi:pimeloyl-ACP methyl ester carboxylesterase